MASSRIVLISGCSSGIGLHTAVLLAKDHEKRFKVYATMRNLDKKKALEDEANETLGKTLIIKRMDVSSDDSVKSAVEEIIAQEGKIDDLSKKLVSCDQDFLTEFMEKQFEQHKRTARHLHTVTLY